MEANTRNDGFAVQRPEPSVPVGPDWKPDLYKLQQEAPKPRAVYCEGPVAGGGGGGVTWYGRAFHGAITQADARRLLRSDGDYLVRISSSSCNNNSNFPNNQPVYTLSMRFNGALLHYKLFVDAETGEHFVCAQRRFCHVDALVAHGLVTLYMEREAGAYLAEMSLTSPHHTSPPAYLTLNRLRQRARLLLSGNANEEPFDYDKAHAFKTHTFKGLNWCEFCGNFLWGFTAQGVKCDDCGLSVHSKCSERVPADCWPRLKQLRWGGGGGVFGVDLTSLLKVRRALRPFVVDKCVQEVEARGLTTEGIYRVSGFREEIDALRVAFNRDGENADVSAAAYENISVIAGTLKLYLRMLPTPLISMGAHPLIVKAVQYSSLREQKKCLKEALALLLPAHYNTLKYLIFHLARVVEHQNENKMSSQSLSTVFVPTLMPMPDLSKYGTSLPDLSNEIAALQLLIDHCYSIFS